MEKTRINFVERKFNYFVSVEKVFRLVAAGLDPDSFETSFTQLPYLNDVSGMLKNLAFFRPPVEADVYHVTGHCHYIALVLPPEKTVLTIHDLGFLHTRSGPRRSILKKLLLDWPLRRLKYVTAISEATRDEIEQQVPEARGRIRVIQDPLDPDFTIETKKEFNSARPNILQVGTSANKNVSNLVEAIAGLACRLTLVGELDGNLERHLRERNIDYQTRSELDNDALRREYEAADIVSFCSIYEGFGLPIIEAQGVGIPVVTSNIDPMKNVAGPDGAVLVDPHDPADIRKGIKSLMDDGELRRSVVEKGISNIERFEKKKIAERYAELYREILPR
jgi:glycosyltransferase involved in cell wall biosynthesis